MAPHNLEEEEAAHFVVPTLRLGYVYLSFAAIRTITQPNSTHDDIAFAYLSFLSSAKRLLEIRHFLIVRFFEPKVKKQKLIHADFFFALDSFWGAARNIISRRSFAPWSPMVAWRRSLSFACSCVSFVALGLT